ncbi:MAG: TolC family protein [Muribaculaceae bacterium]|nr:TolC family protein [Muribaculaceae bacterium]
MTFSSILSSIRCGIPAIVIAGGAALAAHAQTPDSGALAGSGPVALETFRELALANNKQLMMSREKIRKAEYQNKEAFAAYLPGFDFNGGYVYNQKELSIFDSDQLLPTKTFDLKTQSYQFNLVTDPATGMPIKGPDGQYIPSQVALIPKEAMTYDIHNVFFGAVTLTQPVYMGGKIVALNRLTKAAERAARALHSAEAENVIYAVDAAYWQVVSLKAKEKLARSFVNLLDSLDRNVNLMFKEGVATRSDVLSVDVKLNSAKVDLTKVENGLVLSRMALAQICGLPIDSQFTLADEDNGTPLPSVDLIPAGGYDMESIYERRPDLRALGQAVEAAHQQSKVALSDMLPKVAIVGAYSFSNPNMFDGFKKRFNGAFSVGATVSIPLWHWGGNYNKYRAAKSDAIVRELELENARELVTLQVSQASFKTQEAYKTFASTSTNLAKADENLRTATLAFREGVATTDNVMEAQTAWLKAHSEQIDALIDVQLCRTYLSKALGTLGTGADAE